MDGDSNVRRFKVRYLFRIDHPPLESVTVEVQRGCVVGTTDAAPDVDLGNVAIIPGLVNAHTHLEFSLLDEELAADASCFADWIRAVLAWRSLRDTRDPDEHQHAVGQGLAESSRHGTALVGEIATQSPWPESYQSTAFTAVRGVRFLELIGISAKNIEDVRRHARAYLNPVDGTPAGWKSGLSPHAPYTVGWELCQDIVRLSQHAQVPVAMHLAETWEEIELLAAHSGPLVELLEERRVWDASSIPRGAAPLDYLELLSRAHRALIIHGNYLQPAEWKFLAAHRDRLSVVYCPRTADYFGHRRYPLAEMVHHGVRIAIGTDSKASNPDLNLFAELQFIRQQHPEVDLACVLKMGTRNGAEALGCELGSLTAVALPDRVAANPFDVLFDAGSRVISLG